MAEVLSQSEIDALLSAVSTGDVDTKPDAAPMASTDWTAYDLTSQEKIIRSRFAGLEGIHDRFASVFRVTLSNMLHRTVSVNSVNTDFVRFGDYLTNVLLPTSINVCLMSNIKGHAILVVGSKLTYALVDAYYGGTERPYSKIGARDEFTGIETQLINKMVRAALGDLKNSWALNYPVDFRYVRSESNPQFVGAIHPTELVAVVSFEVEFENLSGPFTIVLQMSALESIQNHLAVNILSDVSQEVEKWRRHWLQELRTIPLDLRVELGTLPASLRDVRSWKVGKELILNQDAAIPLVVYLQGLEKMKGTMGTCRGSRAVRLTELPAKREG